MVFRYYTNMMSRASRSFASGLMIVGFMLIGFGVIIVALPRIFAYLAGGMFFLAGIGCAVTAVKVFWATRKMEQANHDPSQNYRENVQIHIEEHYQ
jgi:hypothetical protein